MPVTYKQTNHFSVRLIFHTPFKHHGIEIASLLVLKTFQTFYSVVRKVLNK